MCTIAMIIWAIFHPTGERAFGVVATAMAPTMILGDIAVMAPYAAGRQPQPGDVIAFIDPRDGESILMFRVVGIGGETVRMVDGVVEVDGAAVGCDPIGEYVIDFGFETVAAHAFRETLPNGVGYDTLDTEPDGFLDNTPDFAVPAGHYFVLGDNRDNANDSRGVYGALGFVPAKNVLGRMDRILASCKPDGRFLADRTGLAIGPRG